MSSLEQRVNGVVDSSHDIQWKLRKLKDWKDEIVQKQTASNEGMLSSFKSEDAMKKIDVLNKAIDELKAEI